MSFRPPPGIAASGTVCGPLAQKASISDVRIHAGWRFTVTDQATQANIRFTKIHAYNLPAAKPGTRGSFVQFQLVNPGLDSKAVTAKQHGPDPVFTDEEVVLQGVNGLPPIASVQLWESSDSGDIFVAALELRLNEVDMQTERLILEPQPREGRSGSRWKGALSVSFRYKIEPATPPFPGWFQVHLAHPSQPGTETNLVWEDSVLRSISQANDKNDGRGDLEPLHKAAQDGDVAQIRALLSGGALLESRVKFGWTPLLVAVRAAQPDAVAALLSANASLTASDVNGSTSLHRAAYGDSTQVLSLLLDAGASMQAKDKYGRTPLHVAADNGKVQNVLELLSRGASQDVKDNDLMTPVQVAQAAGEHEIVAVLDARKLRPYRMAGGAVAMI